MTELLRCTDPRGREIVVMREQWDDHITAHAEMIGQIGCVEQALTDPTFINRDRDFPSRENYYRPFMLPRPFDRAYLKVCVEFRRAGANPPSSGRLSPPAPRSTSNKEKRNQGRDQTAALPA